jgi:hypothetical protein
MPHGAFDTDARIADHIQIVVIIASRNDALRRNVQQLHQPCQPAPFGYACPDDIGTIGFRA